MNPTIHQLADSLKGTFDKYKPQVEEFESTKKPSKRGVHKTLQKLKRIKAIEDYYRANPNTYYAKIFLQRLDRERTRDNP